MEKQVNAELREILDLVLDVCRRLDREEFGGLSFLSYFHISQNII